MVKLRIIEILEENGKSKYWLWKRLEGMSYQNFNAIISNKTTKISFETLDRLSKALNIPVGSLLEQTNEDNKSIWQKQKKTVI